MSAPVVDIHTITWYLSSDPRLSARVLATLRQAVAAADPMYLPSISIVEMHYLIERGRIGADLLPQLLAELATSQSSLILMPLSLDIARAVGKISRAEVPDMPDRIIAATALHLGLPLVTRDRRIRNSAVPTIW